MLHHLQLIQFTSDGLLTHKWFEIVLKVNGSESLYFTKRPILFCSQILTHE